MSRSFAITSIRAFATAGVLLGAALVPGVVRAQDVTPQRALLNTVPARSVPVAFLDRSAAFEPREVRAVSGETALMARVEAPAPPVQSPIQDAEPIDGARALLGRWRTTEDVPTALSAQPE